MSGIQDIGLMLQGMGAGLHGQGNMFQRNLMLKEQLQQENEDEQRNQTLARQKLGREMAVQRQKTVFTDSAAALKLGKQGRFDLVAQLGQNRLRDSQHFPGVDFSHTEQLTELATMAANGNKEAASHLMKSLENNVAIGNSIGVYDTDDKGWQFENPKLVKKGDSYSWEGVKHNPNDGTSGPYSVPLGSAAGMEIVQSSTGQTPSERVPQIGAESGAREEGKTGVQLKMAPKIARRVATAKAEVADMFKVAAGNRDKTKNHQVYQEAMGRMTEAFGIAYTGPGMDWIPAITENQQKVVATISIMRPILKNAIRKPGEGTWTEGDQLVLDQMMPTRNDHPSVVALKIEMIDALMASETAQQEGVIAGPGNTATPTNANGWPIMEDAAGNRAYVGPNGEVEEIR